MCTRFTLLQLHPVRQPMANLVLVNYRCGKIGLVTRCCLTEYALCDRRQIVSRSKVITIKYLVVNLGNLVWTDIVATNGLITHITLTSFNIYDSEVGFTIEPCAS